MHNPGIQIHLETQNLSLREFQIADWREVHEYATDIKVVKYLPWGPNTEQQTIEYVLRMLSLQNENPRNEYHMAITKKEDGALVGACCVAVRDISKPAEGWLGYVLNRSSWGKGYATETARALIAFGFQQLHLEKIYAMCDVNNAASARVLDKSGMTRISRLDRHILQKGLWRDSFLYSINAQDWYKRQAMLKAI